jgi:acetolactate synthase-1/2/3 large subunit
MKTINPYRVMWELMNRFDRKEMIVTHDAGSPRNQLVPLPGADPRSYIGWGKSCALGTGLGLIWAPSRRAAKILSTSWATPPSV